MTKKVQWGVLGAAKIAMKKVVPAMQRGEWSQVSAIASRDRAKAEQAAKLLGIEKAYGSYEELLADPEIEAIYNPLPNHLHVAWTIKAAEAGKHVLCEKPVGLSVAEATMLVEARERAGVKIAEAFMIRTHPQWVGALELIRAGRIGAVRSAMSYFSYYNADPANIRNVSEYGGGGMMDIGCYLVFASRLIFGQEPDRALSLVEVDSATQTDTLASAILDFPSGQSIFTCSTRAVPYQRVQIFGTSARLEIEIPFNAPTDRPCRIFLDDGAGPSGSRVEMIEFAPCDQYTIQGDLFSRAIREDGDVAVPLEESIKNLAVIEAIFRSAKSRQWESP